MKREADLVAMKGVPRRNIMVERVDAKPDFCGADDCHDGPWVRITGHTFFCDYLNAATDAEAFEALGRKIASLVLGEVAVYGSEERVA